MALHHKQAEELLEAERRSGQRRAEAKAMLAKAEEIKKVRFSALMVEAAEHGAKSAAQQERDARLSSDWQRVIGGYYSAVLAFELADAANRADRLAIDMWRTNQARDRTEMEVYRSNVT